MSSEKEGNPGVECSDGDNFEKQGCITSCCLIESVEKIGSCVKLVDILLCCAAFRIYQSNI